MRAEERRKNKKKSGKEWDFRDFAGNSGDFEHLQG